MSKIIHQLIRLALMLAMFTMPPVSAQSSDLVIVTAKDNIQSLNIDDVARIFLGKITQYPWGEEVIPLNMDPTDPSYNQFARIVLKKTPSQLKAYWAKRIFTGKGKPPQTFKSAEELLELVASDKRYLSYVDKNQATHQVRWVIILNKR